jgi:hypothetical protein
MFEKAFIPGAVVYAYNGFNPTATCTGLQFTFDHNSQPPIIDSFLYWPNGVYTIVVTGSDNTYAGIFAANVIAADSTGTNIGAAKVWSYPTANANYPGACTSSGTDTVGFNTYTFVANKTYMADVDVYFYNATYSSSYYVAAALYTGTYGTGNGPFDACTGTGFISSVSGDNYYYSTITASLVSGQTYTIAFSTTASDDLGFYGVSIEDSINKDTSNSTATFDAPEVSAYQTSTTCTPNGSLKQYDTTVFAALYQTYIIDVSASFDSASALYFGSNTASPPSTCTNFLIVGDTGDGGPLAVQGLVIGFNYTAIVFGYSSGYGPYNLWALTGVQLGTIPPSNTTSGASTTVSSTTVSSTTVSSTTVSGTSGACDATALAKCGTDETTCVTDAGTSISKICSCYGDYFTCGQPTGCFTTAFEDSFLSSCVAVGCTDSECKGSGSGSSPASVVAFSGAIVAGAAALAF